MGQPVRQVPLNVLTTDAAGRAVVDNKALLKTRDTMYKLDVNRTWKINAGSTGVCARFPLASLYRVMLRSDV
jgi:hypothetical protein